MLMLILLPVYTAYAYVAVQPKLYITLNGSDRM